VIVDDEFDSKELSGAPVTEAPWYFRLGCFLSRHKIRGGDRLLSAVRRRGLLDRLVVYSIGENVELRVPIWRPCNQWVESDVRNYEFAFMRILSDAVCQLSGPVTLIDCGADIGIVSAHLVARCKNVAAVIAFEPNAAAFRVLAQNLEAMRVRGDARHAAVGNFCGRGRLVSAPYDASAHAMFVVPDSAGAIEVQRVDELEIAHRTACVIKIDVEGSEVSVVEGASRTIREASQIVVAFEAHHAVAKRSGRDPVEIMHALLAIRNDFTFEVDTLTSRRIVAERNIFDQLPPHRVYNVLARSIG
jgi:FkbM family methyltransferase